MRDDKTQQMLITQYFNWEVQIEHAKSIKEELNPFQIQSTLEAFEYLRKELGEDFPRETYESNHYIKHYFANRAPWTRAWFVWLCDALKEIKPSSKRENLIKKLKSSKAGDCEEAITILEVTLKCARSNFSIELESEILNDTDERKRPDLKITNNTTQEHVLVEITRLTRETQFDDLNMYLFFAAADRGVELQYAGRIYRKLSMSHFHEIQREIETKLMKCIESKSFCKIEHEGVIELGFTPSNNTALFDTWVKLKEFDANTIIYPQQDIISRIRSKVIHKSKQLSSNVPSILVIRSNDFWMDEKDFDGVVSGLEETIYRCPQILAMVIITSELGPLQKGIISKKFSFFITKTERHGYSTKTLLIFNRFNEARISLNSLINLYSAFETVTE